MAKRRARAKMNIPMCAACILLCLTMFSFHFSSGVVARYSTNTDDSDSARVIKFGEIMLTKIGDDEQYIIPGMPLTLNAAVSFEGSESATYVFLEVTPTGSCEVSADGMSYALKEGIVNSDASWTVVKDGEEKWTFLKEDSGTYVYYISLAPNTPLTNRKFFSNTDHQTMVSEDLTADQIAVLQPMEIDFRAGVVQSNGFADQANPVEAAWNSLKTH